MRVTKRLFTETGSPMTEKLYGLLTAVVLIPFASFSQSINARFTTAFYSWEQQVTDSTRLTHARAYQVAQITLSRLGSPNLSFHTYLQGRNDFGQDVQDKSDLLILNAYLQWQRIVPGLDLRVGRQRIFSGPAYGTIDGAQLDYRLKDVVAVRGYVGTLAPLKESVKIDKWADSHMFGFRVSTRKIAQTEIGVSFIQRNRLPVEYASAGQFTQRIVAFRSLQQRLLGGDLRRSFGSNVSVYGRFDYDLIQDRVRRAEIDGQFQVTRDFQLTAEVLHRAPLLDANSIFWVFPNRDFRQAALRGDYRLAQGITLHGAVEWLFYPGKDTPRWDVGVQYGYGYVGYAGRFGFGGQSNGVSGSFRYPLTPQLAVIASSAFSRYALFQSSTAKSTSLFGTLGIQYSPTRHFSIEAHGQGLRNRLLDSDFRFFVRANYWLFRSS